MMTNLTKRPPALLQYTDLVYTVREKSGKFGSSWFATKTILKGKSIFDPYLEARPYPFIQILSRLILSRLNLDKI